MLPPDSPDDLTRAPQAASRLGSARRLDRQEPGGSGSQAAPLEVGHLVAEAVDQFRHAFAPPLTVEVPREQVWAQGDHNRLVEVLLYLLESAHAHDASGAPVAVEVQTLPREARVHVSGGRGSTFTLRLPRLAANEVLRLPRRVLLLDEERTQEAVAERALRAEGFEVLTARDGIEALRQASHLPVDLVLLSVSAPDTQVGSFLAAFAELPRARPIPLLLAGTSRPAWAHPECAFCSRPYRGAELIESVRAALSLSGASSHPAGGSSPAFSSP
jgi:hypothetical protein